MRYQHVPGLALALLAILLLPGCFSITRTERDVYTITEVDTTVRRDVNNAPGGRDNGTIYPSPGTVDIQRRYRQRDSIVNRYYPAFLRLGGIETASFLGSGGSSQGSGNGLFGLYELLTAKKVTDTKIFAANMYRIVPYEVRLRWFQDAPNWTVGTSAFEMFVRQADSSVELAPGEYLVGTLPLYIRKRYFIRDQVPYVMLVPFFGLSVVPSQYVNVGATLDVGSYGGFNVRAYLGLAAGSSTLFKSSQNDKRDYGLTFPYAGIGVSALDFVNKTEELFIEWKDHKHSALEVSGLNIDLVRSLSPKPDLIGSDTTTGGAVFSGLTMRLATASYPLPIGERRWFVGTSLFNFIGLSASEIGYGFLPIRTGYRFNLLYDELNLEPFIELTYYPSTMVHLGARLSIPVYDWARADVVAGYVSGSSLAEGLGDLQKEFFRLGGGWSAAYVGVGIGIGDVFHAPQEVSRP